MASEMAIMSQMAELKESVARISERLEGKNVSVDNHLPFTSKCQEVIDLFRQTGVARTSIEKAWPYGKSHFYLYMRRCPTLKKQWDAAKETVRFRLIGLSADGSES